MRACLLLAAMTASACVRARDIDLPNVPEATGLLLAIESPDRPPELFAIYKEGPIAEPYSLAFDENADIGVYFYARPALAEQMIEEGPVQTTRDGSGRPLP